VAAVLVAVVLVVAAVEVSQNLQFGVHPKRERVETDNGNAGRGGFQQRDMGPPATVLEMGKFIHACEGEMVIESTNPKVPHFNAPIYLENKV
jgi:hypothetical protein